MCLGRHSGHYTDWPFIIEDSMRAEDYLNFVEDVVMPMLDDMPLQSRRYQYVVSTIWCSSTFHTSDNPVVTLAFSR